jgi:hypothetical protein
MSVDQSHRDGKGNNGSSTGDRGIEKILNSYLFSIVSYYYYLFAKREVPNLVQFLLREYGFGESSDDSDQPNDGNDEQGLGPSKSRPEWIQYGAVSVDGEGDESVRGDEDGRRLCRTHDGAQEATEGPVLAQYRNVRKRSVEECR